MRQHEELRYHVQPVKEPSQVSPYHRAFMKWVRTLLPEDKYLQFEKFYRFPAPTVDISERVFTQLERALNADNKYIRAEFNTSENAADFEAYRLQIGDTTFWQTDAFEAVQTAVNSLVLVDLPQQQGAGLPAPEYYLMEITPANVHDVDFNKDGVAEYVVFNLGRHEKAVFDDEFFRLVRKAENAKWEDAVIVFEAAHSTYTEAGELVEGLGYTPCRRLWDDLLIPHSNKVQAKNPLSKLLGQMDEYLFDYYSLRYYKSYGTWPILWEYENKKPEHQHPHHSAVRCDKGYFVVPQDDAFVTDPVTLLATRVPQKARVEVCEECKKSRFTGPGSIKRVTPPQKSNDPDLRTPAGFINPDPEILKQAKEDLEKAKRALVLSAVGSGGASDTMEARNEEDVRSAYEVTQSFLMNFKKHMESAHKWTMETICKLRYGRDFLRATADYGDEFFLKTEEEIKAEYATTKEAGLPDYLLAPIRELISETRYRNNDEQRMRQRILANLQPYPDRTDGELQAWLMASPQTLNAGLLRLRMNFMAYVLEFEREQEMSIVDVASAISFDAKIQLIRERLVSYVVRDFEGENPLAASATGSNQLPGPSTLQKGQRVRVRPDSVHSMGGMEMGGEGVVELISGPALGIRLDSMPDEIHKWYTPDELEVV